MKQYIISIIGQDDSIKYVSIKADSRVKPTLVKNKSQATRFDSERVAEICSMWFHASYWDMETMKEREIVEIRSPGSLELITRWRELADQYEMKSKDTWQKLKTGELPQDDETIYSVYSNSASADALERCAFDLELELDK